MAIPKINPQDVVWSLIRDVASFLFKYVKSLVFVTVEFGQYSQPEVVKFLEKCRYIDFLTSTHTPTYGEYTPSHGLFFFRGVPLWFEYKEGKFSTISFIRWSVDPRMLISAVYPPKPSRPRMVLDEGMESLAEEVVRFSKSKDWYAQRGIPWRMGILLYGPPGTGKTAFAFELARRVNGYLSDMFRTDQNGKMQEIITVGDSNVRLVLLDDIDVLYHGREPCSTNVPNFNVVLKALERPNQITIVTTNHIELVDPAIGQIDEKQRATRPGRIDRIVYVGPMSEPCRRRMVERILPDHPHLHDQMVRDSEGDTAAQIQDRCAALALRLFWGQVDR